MPPFSPTSALSVASSWAIWSFNAFSFALHSRSFSKSKALPTSFSFASFSIWHSLSSSLIRCSRYKQHSAAYFKYGTISINATHVTCYYCSTVTTCIQPNTYWSKVANLWCKKLDWKEKPDVEKKAYWYVYLFLHSPFMWQTDRQTNKQTALHMTHWHTMQNQVKNKSSSISQ